jgi:hypothetical protein
MQPLALSLSIACLVALALALLAWWWERGRIARANRGRQRIATRGEADAVALLVGEGYAIVDRQAIASLVITIDGDPVEVGCRADLIVSRRGELFVAEVKTGGSAPDPRRPNTRRQLLEYLLAFDVDGVLLVDMTAGRVHAIGFDLPGIRDGP